MGKCVYGFTPVAGCDNCDGTGVFAEGDDGTPTEACHFCSSAAIRRGELDGEADGVEYVRGVPAR